MEIYKGCNEEYHLNDRIKEEALFLNNCYKTGFKLKYLNDIEHSYISKLTYAYLKDLFYNKQDNTLKLEPGLIQHYGEVREYNHVNSVYFLTTDTEERRNELFEKEIYLFKSRIDSLLRLTDYKDNPALKLERNRSDDRRVEICFNEKEAALFDVMVERRQKRRERDMRNKYKDMSEKEFKSRLEDYCTYRNIFFETILMFESIKDTIKYDYKVFNFKMFKQEQYEELIKGRDKTCVRKIKFRVCNATLEYLKHFNKDMNDKDLCKYLIYLTMYWHMLGDHDYMLLTKIKNLSNPNLFLMMSDVMSQ